MKSRKTEGASSGVWFKGFMIFLLVIIVVLSLGLTIFYFMHETEDLYLDRTIINTNLNDEFEISIVHTNAESSTTVELQYPETYLQKVSTSEDGLTYKFKAIAPSSTGVNINLLTSNANFTSDMSCLVTIADGSATNPFLVRNKEELLSIGSATRPLTASYKQINDIDLGDISSWTPISDLTNKFSGIYNGNYCTISNLKIADSQTNPLQYAGLFGYVTGSVINLKIVDANIETSANFVGIVAGYSEGTISRVETTGAINQTTTSTAMSTNCAMGGIVGFVNRNGSDTKVDRCSFTGKLTKTGTFASYSNIGGLIGRNVGGTIYNSYAKAEVVSAANNIYAGGLVGYNRYSEEAKAQGKDPETGDYRCKTNMKGNIVNAYSIFDASQMSGSSVAKGAVVGYNLNVDETLTSGFVDDETKNVNRFIGVYYLKNDSHTLSWMNGASDVETFVTGINESALKTQETYKTFEATTDRTVKVNSTWDFANVWAISASENYGCPTLQFRGGSINPTIYDPNTTIISNEIRTAEQLSAIRNDLTEDYILAADIDLSSYSWEPIGTEEHPFEGSLTTKDGVNYSIKNLKVINSAYSYAGLFGVISESAKLSGFTVSGATIVVGDKVGVVAGLSNGTIDGVSVEGTINISNSTSAEIGMLVANATSTSVIMNVQTRGTITLAVANDAVNETVGAVVGRNLGTVSDVKSKASINISSNSAKVNIYVGGIVGFNDGKIVRAERYDGTSITVTGKAGASYIGGITGYNTNSVSDSVVKSVEIAATGIGENSYVGGISGANVDGALISVTEIVAGNLAGQNVGGLVGFNKSTSLSKVGVTRSMVDGNVTLSGHRVAGLIANVESGEINNCATFASLSADYMSGYASYIKKPAKVTLCFSASTFNLDAGKGFAATESEVFQREWSLLGFAKGDKIAGYLEKTVYDKELAAGTEVKHSSSTTMFGDHGDHDDGAKSHEDCLKAKTYTSRGFSSVYWIIIDGEYPIVKDIPALS